MARLLHAFARMTRRKTCAHPGCTCEVVDRFVIERDRKYCSTSCARGRGCGHWACGCEAVTGDRAAVPTSH